MEKNKKVKSVQPNTPENMAFQVIKGMYDELSAKMVVALYKERDRAVRDVARKYKINL